MSRRKGGYKEHPPGPTILEVLPGGVEAALPVYLEVCLGVAGVLVGWVLITCR